MCAMVGKAAVVIVYWSLAVLDTLEVILLLK